MLWHVAVRSAPAVSRQQTPTPTAQRGIFWETAVGNTPLSLGYSIKATEFLALTQRTVKATDLNHHRVDTALGPYLA